MPGPLEVTDPAEGAVDWDGAKEFFTGGNPEAGSNEGDEAGDENEPEIKEFKIGNRTLRVPADDYAALEGLRRSAQGATRLGSELAQTRERLARLEGTVAARTPEKGQEPEIAPPSDDLAITDFAAWRRQYDAYHAAKMERFASTMEQRFLDRESRSRQAADQTARDNAWASRFYATHDHLDHPDLKPLVSQAYIENRAEIDAFGSDIDGAQARLAELAEQKVVSVRKAGKTSNSNRPPRIESSAGPAPQRRQQSEDRPVATGASWLAKERARMRGETPRK